MKTIITIVALMITTITVGQLSEVRFIEKTFTNGMNYPQVVIPGGKAQEDSINQNIRTNLADLEASDFCIGQYGYVQKSTHLQIHIFCNCIDFDESQNRYYLYNLDEGKNVPYSDLLNPKKKADASTFISEKLKAFTSLKSISLTEEQVNDVKNKNLDAFKVEMTKDGVNLWMRDVEGWGETPMTITWIELKPYLKYHFI